MKKYVAVLCALLLAVPAVSFAAITNDEITSAKLKEADNNGSQDTNSGSGVKTNHIQNLAVTGAKIADSAVTSAKILDGSVAAADLAAGAVTGAKIVDGAVSDVKISGTISASKISGTVGNADTVDGKHAAEFAPAAHAHAQSDVTGLSAALAGKAAAVHVHDASSIVSGALGVERLGTYADVRIVHKGAADGISTFNDVTAALNSIADASAANRHAVLVMPGEYPAFSTKDYVDIIGVSRTGTVIKGAGIAGYGGTVTVANNAFVSNLTVEATDGIAIFIGGSYAGVLGCDVRVVSSGTGMTIGKWNEAVFGGNSGHVTVKDIRIAGPSAGFTGFNLGFNYEIDSQTASISDIEVSGAQDIGGGISTWWESSATSPLHIANFNAPNMSLGISYSKMTFENLRVAAISLGSAGNIRASVTVVNGVIGRPDRPPTEVTMNVDGDLYLDRSTVYGSNFFNYNSTQSDDKIYMSSCKFSGALSPDIYNQNGRFKFVNCTNGSYDPIPDGEVFP